MALIHTTVTKHTLETSSYTDSTDCALAKTLKRALKLTELRVGSACVLMLDTQYNLTKEVGDLVHDMCYRKRGGKLVPSGIKEAVDIPIVIDTINKTISIDEKE